MKATNITLSFSTSGVSFKRKSQRTGGYFVFIEGKLHKEYATYEGALNCYRKLDGAYIVPRASAITQYGELMG